MRMANLLNTALNLHGFLNFEIFEELHHGVPSIEIQWTFGGQKYGRHYDKTLTWDDVYTLVAQLIVSLVCDDYEVAYCK